MGAVMNASSILALATALSLPPVTAEYAATGPPSAGEIVFERLPMPHPPRPRHVPFPPIKDWASLRIALSRSECYGSCPVYDVEIASDGTVTYDGRNFVLVGGKHVSHITPERVRALFAAFRKAEFFTLYDDYRAGITDSATYVVSIGYDGRKKSVADYVGRMIGMPPDVTALEIMIDDTAGTARWVDGDAHTVPALEAEGFDFSPRPQTYRLVMVAAENGTDDAVRMLLAKGIPVSGAASAYGCRAVSHAAERGRIAALKALLDAGAPVADRAGISDGDEVDPGPCFALDGAAFGASPDAIRLLLAHGADVRRFDPERGPPLTQLGIGLSGSETGRRDIVECARLLIAAGADVNYRLKFTGDNLLHLYADNAPILKLLLQAGAKGINEKDDDDQTPLMGVKDAQGARLLLEAGADPYARDKQGDSALDWALANHHAEVATVLRAWMSMHPKPAGRP
jgi:ankyrin repeat protein